MNMIGVSGGRQSLYIIITCSTSTKLKQMFDSLRAYLNTLQVFEYSEI